MRTLLSRVFFLLLALETAYAGQIYGSIADHGKAVPGAAIAIDCGGTVASGATAADGSYRVHVPREGRCSFTVTIQGRRGSLVVFSYQTPSQYDFEVERRPDGTFELKRR